MCIPMGIVPALISGATTVGTAVSADRGQRKGQRVARDAQASAEAKRKKDEIDNAPGKDPRSVGRRRKDNNVLTGNFGDSEQADQSNVGFGLLGGTAGKKRRSVLG